MSNEPQTVKTETTKKTNKKTHHSALRKYNPKNTKTERISMFLYFNIPEVKLNCDPCPGTDCTAESS